MSIVICNVLAGTPDMEFFREILKTLIDVTDDNGNKRYPQLTQYIDTWMGYPFWRDDKTFSLDNHLTYINCEELTTPKFKQMQEDLLNKSFDPKRSPWEMVIVPNLMYDELSHIPGPKTVMFFRVHHSIADGFSLLKLFLTLSKESTSKQQLQNLATKHEEKRTFSKMKQFSRILKMIAAPYTLAYMLLDSFCWKPWGLHGSEYANECMWKASKLLSVQDIKTIKNGHNVSFLTVVLSALTSAIRKGLLLKGLSVPKRAYIFCPFPIPGHKNKLSNHATFGGFSLPIGELNPVNRLRKCNESVLFTKRWLLPELLYFACPIAGGVCPWILKPIIVGGIKIFGIVSGLAYVPGPENKFSCNGVECFDTSYTISVPQGVMGLGFTALSYVGGLRIAVGADKAVFSNTEEEIKQIINAAEQEIEILLETLRPTQIVVSSK